ncbi:MAG: redoxin family protein [Phycisphaerales bacterium]|jgi:hypothetical protein
MHVKTRLSRRLAIAAAAACCVSLAHAGLVDDVAAKAEVGKPAPAFTLTDTGGTTHNLADFKGKTVVLEWFSPYCPWSGGESRGSVHRNGKVKSLVEKMKAVDPNVVYVLVNSTHQGRPEKEIARDSDAVLATTGVKLPILMDYDGTVGKMYGAKVTPHLYVIDGEGVLRYQGAFDSDRNSTDGSNYVLEAVTAIKNGETPSTASTRPYGCGVKYKR